MSSSGSCGELPIASCLDIEVFHARNESPRKGRAQLQTCPRDEVYSSDGLLHVIFNSNHLSNVGDRRTQTSDSERFGKNTLGHYYMP